MQGFWISWWSDPAVSFELHSPWWRSGWRTNADDTEQSSICAAVMAEDEDDAKRIITEAHDAPVDLEWRFAEAKPEGWTPYNDRFRQATWMRWGRP